MNQPIDTTKVYMDVNGDVCLLNPKDRLQRVVQHKTWTAGEILRDTIDGLEVVETYELHDNIEALNKRLEELK